MAAALGPGYVFVRIEERRRPRPHRSGLLETAELVVIGGFSSKVAFVCVAAVSVRRRWLSERKLADHTSNYLLSHVERFSLLLLVTLALAYALTWLAAMILFHGRPATIQMHSAWDEVFKPEPGIVKYATVGLDDGLAVAGDGRHTALATGHLTSAS
jgi:hypothetical protein